MHPRRWWLVVLFITTWVLCSTQSTLVAVRPTQTSSPLPSSILEPPGTPRLARRVLFVVIDGLRWDIATSAKTMPRLSQVIAKHHGSTMTASRVTMTSSAVLAYGTGQHGGLDQVLENLHPPRPVENDWLTNAKRAGVQISIAGDRAWSQLYGTSLREFRPDPEGVGIDVDFNRETFRNASQLRSMNPDVLVAHFVTPDHQGHAYGVKSPRYTQHVRDFDRDLFDWIDSFERDWTIIVTSDHGAADTGTHGTDTIEQRRCPFVAYGPGIRRDRELQRELDQTEIPGLMSALLGVSNAGQSRSTIPFEWLDEPVQSERVLACREIQRLSWLTRQKKAPEVAKARTDAEQCCAEEVTGSCAHSARHVALVHERFRVETDGLGSPGHVSWLVAALLAACAVIGLVQGLPSVSVVVFGALWLALSLGLTYGVERLSGAWPNGFRATLFVVANSLLLSVCVGVVRRSAWLNRFPKFVLSVFPGWLIVSYTANTQIEMYIVVVVLVFLGFRGRWPSGTSRSGAKEIVIAVLALSILAMPGTHASDVTPMLFTRNPTAAAWASAFIVVPSLFVVLSSRLFRVDLTALGEHVPSKTHPAKRVVQVIIAVAGSMCAYGFRHLPLSWAGRLIGLTLVTAAVVALLSRRNWKHWSFVLGLASTLWFARDFECVVLAACLTLASVTGYRVSKPDSECPFGAGQLANTMRLTLYFALSALLWIGLQGGLQLNALDFAAGTFGDSHVPAGFIAACLTYKFVMAEALLFSVYTRGLPLFEQLQLARGVVILHVARGVALLSMLAVCGHSYWTAFRVVADLPFALIGVWGAVGYLALMMPRETERRIYERDVARERFL